ncbi:hypothetical protein GGE65_001282 [Skermanella aerolata]|uniref:hypothetical protein n=1 Tax=Skermanella aerolata TaxID=393310 RepID=UPI003D252D80
MSQHLAYSRGYVRLKFCVVSVHAVPLHDSLRQFAQVHRFRSIPQNVHDRSRQTSPLKHAVAVPVTLRRNACRPYIRREDPQSAVYVRQVDA